MVDELLEGRQLGVDLLGGGVHEPPDPEQDAVEVLAESVVDLADDALPLLLLGGHEPVHDVAQLGAARLHSVVQLGPLDTEAQLLDRPLDDGGSAALSRRPRRAAGDEREETAFGVRRCGLLFAFGRIGAVALGGARLVAGEAEDPDLAIGVGAGEGHAVIAAGLVEEAHRPLRDVVGVEALRGGAGHLEQRRELGRAGLGLAAAALDGGDEVAERGDHEEGEDRQPGSDAEPHDEPDSGDGIVEAVESVVHLPQGDDLSVLDHGEVRLEQCRAEVALEDVLVG